MLLAYNRDQQVAAAKCFEALLLSNLPVISIDYLIHLPKGAVSLSRNLNKSDPSSKRLSLGLEKMRLEFIKVHVWIGKFRTWTIRNLSPLLSSLAKQRIRNKFYVP